MLHARFYCLFALCWSLMLAPAAVVAAEGYRLNAGDTIRIHVYGEPDLTFDKLLVGSNGVVSYPFLGELQVGGRSVSQLQVELLAGL